MVDIDKFWGCPDEVTYMDTESYMHHTLWYENNGYTFGIWDGVLVCGNDEDETSTLMHMDLIDHYIYLHGWKGRSGDVGGDILPACEVDPGCDLKWSTFENLPVRYEYDDEFEKSGRERRTYADLINSLGSPRCRGRILYDWENRVSFISFWSLPSLEEMKLVAKAYGKLALNAYFVVCKDEDDATEYYGTHRKLTFSDVIRNDGRVNISDNSEQFALHNMKASRKWDKTGDFRRFRGEKLGKKLRNMTMAQYHNLIYGEGIERLRKIIKEEISSYILKNGKRLYV